MKAVFAIIAVAFWVCVVCAYGLLAFGLFLVIREFGLMFIAPASILGLLIVAGAASGSAGDPEDLGF